MANQDAAFGLKPIGKIGQNRDAQGLSEYSIAANDSSTIYFQDPVKATAAGTIDVAAAGDVLLGSLNGVFYTDPNTKKPTWANHYSQVNSDLTIYRRYLDTSDQATVTFPPSCSCLCNGTACAGTDYTACVFVIDEQISKVRVSIL